MSLHQDKLRKAQAEVDAVVGTHRLPTFEDRDKLPYVNAVCKEVLRWHAISGGGKYLDLFNPKGVLTQSPIYGSDTKCTRGAVFLFTVDRLVKCGAG